MTTVLMRDTQRRDREDGHVMTEAEMGQCGHEPRDAGAPRSWTRQERPSPRVSERSTALPHLDLKFLAPECERLNLCCFKPPSLWYFVLAASGNPPAHPALCNL